jgi:hypothetical protein
MRKIYRSLPKKRGYTPYVHKQLRKLTAKNRKNTSKQTRVAFSIINVAISAKNFPTFAAQEEQNFLRKEERQQGSVDWQSG